MDQQEQIDKAAALVEEAMRAGAQCADAVIVHSQSVSVEVRKGKIEETQSAESVDFSLRVFMGRRLASVSANLSADLKKLAERAVAMAKVSPESLYESLVDEELLAKTPRDLDLFDHFVADSRQLTNDALATEEAALNVSGVTNSGGAEAAYGTEGLVLVTSNGFLGAYRGSRFSRSVSVVAGSGSEMERDYDYSSAVYFSDLKDPAAIGRSAGERAVKRLNSRAMATGNIDVIFDPRVARGIAGHIAAMVNGSAVARKTSLLKDKMGERIMRADITVSDNPLYLRGVGSKPFDGEGVEGQPLNVIEDGVLCNWLLSSSTARELNLKTNGRGVRSGSNVIPSSTNFTIESGSSTPQELMTSIKDGFYVTELFGHGVDLVTGQYSRGASGFQIVDGQIDRAVSGVTLASNLMHMLSHLTPANDLDRGFAVAAPTLLIEGMTLAGE